MDNLFSVSPGAGCAEIIFYVMLYLLAVLFNVIADIKPSNILVNTHGAVKLCDFGVSVQVHTYIQIHICGTKFGMSLVCTVYGTYCRC